ncbi:MAG: hypothetical protein LBG78_09660 [Azoarcus sp.]|jgi:hypothetical protein|nr:hypothetical protein [Azoarcus sp.]
MRSKQAIALLLMCSILFAPLANSAAILRAFSAQTVATHSASPVCHISAHKTADSGQTQNKQNGEAAPQVSHACCVNFVGIAPPAHFHRVPDKRFETAAYSSPLRLLTRVTDIFHPPRQTA